MWDPLWICDSLSISGLRFDAFSLSGALSSNAAALEKVLFLMQQLGEVGQPPLPRRVF